LCGRVMRRKQDMTEGEQQQDSTPYQAIIDTATSMANAYPS